MRLLLLLSVAAAALAEDAFLSGQALHGLTGQPLRKVHVTLRASEAFSPTTEAFTDDQGRFQVRLPAGSYRLTAERNGFLATEYGARKPKRPGTLLILREGQRLTEVTLRLMPQSVVVGRVWDEEGEPLSGVNVQLLSRTYSPAGPSFQSAGSALTNDLGEFRIPDVAPGRYLLLAQSVRRSSHVGAYRPVFYPGTSDSGQAMTIDVPVARTIGSFDMTLRPAPTIVIRGTLSWPGVEGDSLFRNTSLFLISKHSRFLRNPGQWRIFETGDFEIRDVVPGSYSIAAVCVQGRSTASAVQTIETGNNDLEGIRLSVVPSRSVQGVVKVEGGQANPGQIRVQAQAVEFSPNGSTNAAVSPDGWFQLDRLDAVTYRISLAGLPAGAYLKSIRAGATDVLKDGLNPAHLSDGDRMEVLVSMKGGSVRAAVLDASGQPVTGVQVGLVPEDVAEAPRTKTGLTGADGVVAIHGIPPGRYRLFAVDSAESGAVYDPAFLQQHRNQAQLLDFGEAQQHQAQLHLIEVP